MKIPPNSELTNEQDRERVEVLIRGKKTKIDSNIVRLVLLMNKAGLKTDSSCGGHLYAMRRRDPEWCHEIDTPYWMHKDCYIFFKASLTRVKKIISDLSPRCQSHVNHFRFYRYYDGKYARRWQLWINSGMEKAETQEKIEFLERYFEKVEE